MGMGPEGVQHLGILKLSNYSESHVTSLSHTMGALRHGHTAVAHSAVCSLASRSRIRTPPAQAWALSMGIGHVAWLSRGSWDMSLWQTTRDLAARHKYDETSIGCGSDVECA